MKNEGFKFPKKALQAVQKERIALGVRKSNDYSSAIDAISLGGVRGIAILLMNKAARLMSLTDAQVKQMVKDESIRDTLLDVGNYADYGVCLIDGTWAKRERKITRRKKHAKKSAKRAKKVAE